MKKSALSYSLFLLVFSATSFGYESDGYPMEDDGYYMDGSGESAQPAPPPRRQKMDRPRYRNNGYFGTGKTFVFDPKALRWYAYFQGELVNSGSASGGKRYCPDIGRPCRTPSGVFRVSSMGGPGCKSSKYPIGRGNAPMPWCMFFHGGYAIHGGQVPGYNASHGCIRVHPSDARWLSQNFMNYGTKVVVKSYW